MRRGITASAALIALSAAASTAFGASGAGRITSRPQSAALEARVYYGGQISRFQKETWHWQRLMGVRLTPRFDRGLSARTPLAIRHTAEVWRRRSAQAYQAARRPPHLRQFLCIHRYEATWTDTGSPYYGGLQMDLGFQQHYGGWLLRAKGTANHWSPLEQIWTAEKALKTRGFWPWPNTARSCGLL